MEWLWGWEERGNLEKIMLDYVRWIEFCTPRINERISYGYIKSRLENKSHKIREIKEKEGGQLISVLLKRKRKG